MTHVKLMGELGEKFGTDWHMNVKNFRDIFKLIECQTEGFKSYLLKCAEKGIDFDILNGADLVEDGFAVMLEHPKDTIVITPKATGAGASDVIKVIVGIVLFMYGYDFIMNLGGPFTETTSGTLNMTSTGGGTVEISTTQLTTYGEIAAAGTQLLGAGLAMSGVTGYFTPDSPSEAGESYLFDGPQNNTKQGVPVPLLYGELIVGGAITNFGFIPNRVNFEQTGYTLVEPDDSSPPGSWGDYGQDTNGHNQAGGGGNGASGQQK